VCCHLRQLQVELELVHLVGRHLAAQPLDESRRLAPRLSREQLVEHRPAPCGQLGLCRAQKLVDPLHRNLSERQQMGLLLEQALAHAGDVTPLRTLAPGHRQGPLPDLLGFAVGAGATSALILVEHGRNVAQADQEGVCISRPLVDIAKAVLDELVHRDGQEIGALAQLLVPHPGRAHRAFEQLVGEQRELVDIGLRSEGRPITTQQLRRCVRRGLPAHTERLLGSSTQLGTETEPDQAYRTALRQQQVVEPHVEVAKTCPVQLGHTVSGLLEKVQRLVRGQP